ncbi:motility protein A [Halomonas salinarum]|uniref:motility protein A n=1 Tax=Halomonas salinarum TaxID=1158993 RepID=UPI00143B7CC3|nr:MotA/TolQ/ExbB proton channel family protein [Halomonas salinarum]
MNPSTLIGMLASMGLLGIVLLFTAESPQSFLNLPGLAIVVTGTLAATFISYPLKEVLRVVRLVGLVFRRENTYAHDDIRELVAISRLWFKGDVRAVEEALEKASNPFLRTGVQLVIANTKEEDILELLRWRIARLKAREFAEAQIFRTMATYAPAFGMIGTLVGLVNMLEVMEAGDIGVIGPRMAIALLTTFYGILLANLVFKPIAVKLERRTEERLIAMNMVLEGISLICRRRLPSFIEETLNSFMANYRDEIRDVPPRLDTSGDEQGPRGPGGQEARQDG